MIRPGRIPAIVAEPFDFGRIHINPDDLDPDHRHSGLNRPIDFFLVYLVRQTLIGVVPRQFRFYATVSTQFGGEGFGAFVSGFIRVITKDEPGEWFQEVQPIFMKR